MSAPAVVSIDSPDLIWKKLKTEQKLAIKRRIRRDTNLSHGAVRMYEAVFDHCWARRRARVLESQLAEDAGMPLSTGRRYLKELCDAGHVLKRRFENVIEWIIPLSKDEALLKSEQRHCSNLSSPLPPPNKERATTQKQSEKQPSTAFVTSGSVGASPPPKFAAEQTREKRRQVLSDLQWLEVLDAEVRVEKADMLTLLRMEWAAAYVRKAVTRADRHNPIKNPGGLFTSALNSPWCRSAVNNAISPPPAPPPNPEQARFAAFHQAYCADHGEPKTEADWDRFSELWWEHTRCDERRQKAPPLFKSSASLIEGHFGGRLE